MSNVDEDKGNYCLIIRVCEDCRIKIGALGIVSFDAGYYVYVGSALNSLKNRVSRHLSSEKKKHWHSDYLLLNKNTKIVEVIYTYCNKKIECEISHHLDEDSCNNIASFGCSDCNCESHLYYFDSYEKALKSSIQSYEKLKLVPHKWINQHND